MNRTGIRAIFSKIQNRMSFGTRLFAAFFCVAVPILLIICAALYIFLNRSSQEGVTRTMLQTLEQISGTLEYVAEDTQNLSRNIIYDSDVQALLDEAASGDAYPETDAVKYFINSFIVNRDYIESVVLMGLSDTVFSTEKAYTNVSSKRQIEMKWWYPLLDHGEEPYTWYPQAKRNVDDDLSDGLPDQTLMLTRPILSTRDYRTTVGQMMIYLKNDYMTELISSIPWGESLSVWVCDSQGNPLLYNDAASRRQELMPQLLLWGQESLSQGEIAGSILKLGGVSYVAGVQSVGDDAWQLLMLVPLGEVNDSAPMISVQIVSMVIVILLIVVITATMISRNLARPIRQISQIMDSYHNHPQVQGAAAAGHMAPPECAGFRDRRDEVGTIYRSYERMAERVDTLIREIYLKDLEKKDAQLALMQSQINPHFLYNTLDSINWMAMANGQDEISEMVTALSDTFRLSLKRTDSSYIQILSEIEYLDSYLTLQKYRFGGRLDYHFHVDESIKQLFILRFILQPIVENAIKHGIACREEGGVIDISMDISEETGEGGQADEYRYAGDSGREPRILTVHVVNDGTDIDLAAVAKLLEFDEKTQTFLSFDQKSYGLQNINRRIKIVHGPEYGIYFHITENGRTDCCAVLPYVDKDMG